MPLISASKWSVRSTASKFLALLHLDMSHFMVLCFVCACAGHSALLVLCCVWCVYAEVTAILRYYAVCVHVQGTALVCSQMRCCVGSCEKVQRPIVAQCTTVLSFMSHSAYRTSCVVHESFGHESEGPKTDCGTMHDCAVVHESFGVSYLLCCS